MRLQNLTQPVFGKALAHLEVEGQRLDLHAAFQLVGLNYGIQPAAVTMGWVATTPRRISQGGRTHVLSGLVIHFEELQRFEIALNQAETGALDYFELREEPESSWVFFFEGGTVRLSASVCRAELLFDDEGDDADEFPILQ